MSLVRGCKQYKKADCESMGCMWDTKRYKCRNPPSTFSPSVAKTTKDASFRQRLTRQQAGIVRNLMKLIDEGMSRSMRGLTTKSFWKSLLARKYARVWYSMQDSCKAFLRVVHNDGTYTLVNETGTYPLPVSESVLKSRVKVLGRHFYIRRGNTRQSDSVPTNDLRKEVERILHDMLTSSLERCIRRWEVVRDQFPSWKKVDLFVKIRGFNPTAGNTPRTQPFRWMYVDAKEWYPLLDVSKSTDGFGLRPVYVSDVSRVEKANRFIEQYLEPKF